MKLSIKDPQKGRKHKIKTVFQIFTNYGYGWQEEDTAETFKEAVFLANEYRNTSLHPSVRINRKK